MTVYALDQVGMYVGNREMKATGEGEFFEIARREEEWENNAMADGQIVSSKILDDSATVTLTLRYDSPSNNVLQRYAAARQTVDFSCAWPNGDYVNSAECRVQKYPDIADGMTPGNRQWTLFLADTTYKFGPGA
jgi:hypothetical protein